MIVRIWKGSTAAKDADRYLEYLRETGLREYGETEGNLGGLALRRSREGELTEFLTVSFWRDMSAIEGFAGPEPERAVFYDDDDRYLVEADPFVAHYEVVDGSWPTGSVIESGG